MANRYKRKVIPDHSEADKMSVSELIQAGYCYTSETCNLECKSCLFDIKNIDKFVMWRRAKIINNKSK